MAGTVGGVSCSRVIGEPHTQAMRSSVWQIPGIDGYGIHLHGLGDGEAQFILVLFGNETTIPIWEAAIRTLQGTIVTIVNDQSKTITNQFIVRVGRPVSRTAYDLVSTTRRVELVIETLTV